MSRVNYSGDMSGNSMSREMSGTPDPILTDAMHTAPGDRKVTEVSRGQEETYAVYCNYVCSTSSA